MIDLPDATAVDNSGLDPKTTVSHKSPLKVFVGSPVRVTYTATDDTVNSRNCYINIEVKDNEPPKVVSCPQDKVFKTGKVPHQVFWGDPQFHDNVDGTNVNVIPSTNNGNFFPRGSHKITYLARDKQLNSVTCTFTIQIELMQCPVYTPPKHGASTCNIRKDGVIETHVCTVACKQNAWFIKGPNIPTLYHFYVCSENGQWRGQNKFNPTQMTHFTPIPKGQTPWPDCAVGKPPDGVAMEFQVFGGSCKDQKQLEQLKKDFLNALKTDLIINSLYCSTNTTNCVLENFRVHCAFRRRRSAGGIVNQVVVKFTLAVRDLKLSSSQSAEIMKLNTMTTTLNGQKTILMNKLKKTAPSVMKDSSASVSANNAEISCEPGYEYKVVDGGQATSDRIKCLKCPRGTYYDQTTKICTVCQAGHYQENEASLSCKKCPANTSTYGTLAHNFHQCKDICKPGTHSSTGLATCLACPISTYQPLENRTSCVQCPAGKVTSSTGATSISDCSEPGLNIFIRSEGCGDPGIYQATCGMSIIKVNEQDHCLHQRGLNFVVFDAGSGTFLQSTAFDWHGDYNACTKTWNWVNGLRDEVIVLVAIQDEATTSAYDVKCYQALELIGGKRPFQTEYRASFAMIGYKGKYGKDIDWVKQIKSHYGRGPAELRDSIKLLTLYVHVAVHSEGCNDPGVTNCGTSTITVNGKDHSQHNRGLNFVVLDAYTGKLLQTMSFDWHGDSNACSRTWQWISTLRDELIVLVALQDEGTTNMGNEKCPKSLELIGGKRPFQNQFRMSFAMIGYKGNKKVTRIQQKTSPPGQGPTDLKESIKLLTRT